MQTICTWTVRLAIPILLGVLVSALHLIWAESPYKPGLLDIIGTVGIAIAMLGMVVWCVGAWFDTTETPAIPPLDGEMQP